MTRYKVFVNNALVGHAFCHCGEISAMKGLLGKKGPWVAPWPSLDTYRSSVALYRR
jgi:hypothetical protein